MIVNQNSPFSTLLGVPICLHPGIPPGCALLLDPGPPARILAAITGRAEREGGGVAAAAGREAIDWFGRQNARPKGLSAFQAPHALKTARAKKP